MAGQVWLLKPVLFPTPPTPACATTAWGLGDDGAVSSTPRTLPALFAYALRACNRYRSTFWPDDFGISSTATFSPWMAACSVIRYKWRLPVCLRTYGFLARVHTYLARVRAADDVPATVPAFCLQRRYYTRILPRRCTVRG